MSSTDDLAPQSDGLLAGPPMPAGSSVALAGSTCTDCGRWEFPARRRCPSCRADAVAAPLSTNGRVVGFTSVHHPPPGAMVDVPYTVALVAFPEGVSVLGRIVESAVDHIEQGAVVETVSTDVGGRLGYGYRLIGNA